MKRFLSVLLATALLISSSASAASFSSVSQLQQLIRKYSPDTISSTGPHIVDLEGTISSIYWCNANNHYEMILQMEDDRALVPVGSDLPQVVVHFRLHVDPMPFQVGDVVTVYGSLNSSYSSVMLPSIDAEFINGNDDF